MRTIDLRSDTVTKPTPEMLEAMFQAEVGDDVFEEDPTVKKLEEKAAALFGKEMAMFVPSGTMANQVAIKLLTHSQEEVICDKLSHIYYYEAGGVFSNSGISMRMIDGNRGRITAAQVEENINDAQNIHFPLTSLVSIENTCNKGGGSFYQIEEMKSLHTVAQKYHLKMHMDGARIFNAVTETKDDLLEIGKLFDTISFCLSKGLGAPVGSLVLSTRENIHKGKRIRKAFGGAMRQAGYLAAAGIYALDHHRNRLADDHHRAKLLSQTIKSCSFTADVLPVETNILVFRLVEQLPLTRFIQLLAERNIKAVPFGKQTIRMVTHLDFTDEMLDETVNTIRQIAQKF